MGNSTSLTIQQVRHSLKDMAPDLATMLPPDIKPERFITVALTAVQQTPKLLECASDSLFNACKKAAQDGLLPDGREGAIIPRYNSKAKRLEATWQPMLAGIQAKAKRRGNVATLSANVVYEGEPFEVLLGDDDKIRHRRDISKVKPGNEIAVYAIATMKDGSKEREVMSWDQVMKVRSVSSDPNGSTWTQWTDEMAKKTVIRRLSKRLPSLDDGDDDLKQAIDRVDELYPFGKPAAPAPTLDAKAEPPAADEPPAEDGEAAAFDPPLSLWLDGVNTALAAEKDGRKWLRTLRMCLDGCPDLDELAGVRDLDGFKPTYAGAPAAIKADIDALIQATAQRLQAPPPAQEAAA